MRIPMRAIALSVAVLLSCGGFVIACPEWTHDLGLDVWNYGEESAELEVQQRRSAQLHQVGDRVLKRIEMKDAVVDQLIKGQIGLPEATEQFQTLNELDPELLSYIRVHFAGKDDREKTARQVINFTRMKLCEEPADQKVVAERLQRELQHMLEETATESTN